MLQSISEYVQKYTKIIATVTHINIEVVNEDLIRIAGTGMYSSPDDYGIKVMGNVYRHVLKSKEQMVVYTPKEDIVCQSCQNLEECLETLAVCTPIIYNGKPIGVIGIICFTQEERQRIMPQLKLYQDFVQQMSEALSLAVSDSHKIEQTQNILDTFLEIADVNNRGIITLNNDGIVTYCNEMANSYLGIENIVNTPVGITKTGDTLGGMEEFLLSFGGNELNIVGQFSNLSTSDDTFAQLLMFDTLPTYLNVLTRSISAYQSDGLSSIVGNSKKMSELKQQVIKISDTKSTILITGESGTGKEIFARAIHEVSERADKPFIAINCGAIPDALLESELFGYVSGAFTGARSTGHVGKFEMSDQGVLFLDEIGAMPLYLQVKLLRVLQERTVTRLGSNREISIDARIIAATNDDLQELISQRMFREDLYYRLNVIPFKIPPLRERLEDIPDLANFFLDKYCRLFDKKLVRPTPRLISTLQKYSWPGNVREFENIMEYLVNIIPDGGSATVNMLPQKLINFTQSRFSNKLAQQVPVKKTETEIVPIADLERQAITNAMEFYGDSMEAKHKVSEALGIGIATLYRKLASYDKERQQK